MGHCPIYGHMRDFLSGLELTRRARGLTPASGTSAAEVTRS